MSDNWQDVTVLIDTLSTSDGYWLIQGGVWAETLPDNSITHYSRLPQVTIDPYWMYSHTEIVYFCDVVFWYVLW